MRAAAKVFEADPVYSMRRVVSPVRSALATIGVTETFPEGLEYPLSPVERGRVIEEYRNCEAGFGRRKWARRF